MVKRATGKFFEVDEDIDQYNRKRSKSTSDEDMGVNISSDRLRAPTNSQDIHNFSEDYFPIPNAELVLRDNSLNLLDKALLRQLLGALAADVNSYRNMTVMAEDLNQYSRMSQPIVPENAYAALTKLENKLTQASL